MSSWIQYGDEIEKYRVAQSVVEHGQFSFRPTAVRIEQGVGGQNFSIYELGQTIIEVPFYLLGKLFYFFYPTRDVNDLGQLAVGLLNPLLCALVCVLFFQFCLALEFKSTTAIVLSVVLAIGTVLGPYSKGYTREPLMTLLILAACYSAWRYAVTQANRWLWVAGFLVGYLTFTKFIQGMVIPIVLVYLVFVIYQHRRQSGTARSQIIKGVLIFLSPILLFLVFQAIYSWVRFGTLYSGLGTQREPFSFILYVLTLGNPLQAIAGLLFSMEKSIIVYSPPALLFLVAWFAWYRLRRREAVFVLAIVLVEFISVVVRFDWDGGSWWGPRYLVQITPLLILPIGVLLEMPKIVRRRIWSIALGVLFCAGLFMYAIGSLTNNRDYYDTYRESSNVVGQVHFLGHGVIDSIIINLSPQGLPVVTPFGFVLPMVVLITGLGLVQRMRSGTTPTFSVRASGTFLAIVLLVEAIGFVAWVVAPYPEIFSAKADTRYVAANSFRAEGRLCEANALYLYALARNTHYQQDAAAQFERLNPRAPSQTIPLDGAWFMVAQPEETSIEGDTAVTIASTASLRFSIPGAIDRTAMITLAPIGVRPNREYEFSGWTKSVGVYGTGVGSISVHEDNGDWGNARVTDIAAVQETNGWYPFVQTIKMLPTSRRIFINLGLNETFGTLWVDGLAMGQVDPTQPIARLYETPCVR